MVGTTIQVALLKAIQSRFAQGVLNDHILSTNDEKILVDNDFNCGLLCMEPGEVRGEDLRVVTPPAKEVRREIKQIEDDLTRIAPGCVHFGAKPPKNACYVGRYGDLYAWVLPEGVFPLSDLTLKVINFSNLIKESSVVTIPGGGPRYTPSPAASLGR